MYGGKQSTGRVPELGNHVDEPRLQVVDCAVEGRLLHLRGVGCEARPTDREAERRAHEEAGTHIRLTTWTRR